MRSNPIVFPFPVFSYEELIHLATEEPHKDKDFLKGYIVGDYRWRLAKLYQGCLNIGNLVN